MSKASKHIGYDEMAAFLAGEYSADREQEIRAWIAASPENRSYYEECQQIFSMDLAGATHHSFDKQRAWEKVSARMDAVDTEETAISASPSSWPAVKWLRVAAVITLLISAVLLIWQPFTKPVSITSGGGTEEYYLPDSTRIVLRGDSRVTYASGFNEHHRKVQLTGEAFFDVTSRPAMPFIIETKEARVQVIGTAFLVRENADSVLVQVTRGVVELRSRTDETAVTLRKHEQGVLLHDRHIPVKTPMKETDQLYWGTRTLTFDREPLAEVFGRLEKLFGRKIAYDQAAIKECRISGVFKSQKFEEIMENMSLAMNFTYQIHQDTVTIQSSGCE